MLFELVLCTMFVDCLLLIPGFHYSICKAILQMHVAKD